MKSVSITDLENTGAEAAGMEIPVRVAHRKLRSPQ